MMNEAMTQMIYNRTRWTSLFDIIVGLVLALSVATQGLAQGQSELNEPFSKTPVSNDDHSVAELAQAGGAERLIPFQAYLTDTEGRPIQGQRCLKFQIYDKATGGSQPFVWNETRDSVPIGNGMVNVVLGSIIPFPASATFDAVRYVSVSVGESCTELTTIEPRQQIISAVHAVDADRVGGSPGGFRANSIEITPIGAIIPWFGNPTTSLPSNWMLCDGKAINDLESPLNGIAVPDMRNRFVRGEGVSTRDHLAVGVDYGGIDSVDLLHEHEIQSDGEHGHSMSAPAGSHGHDLTTSGANVFGSGTTVSCSAGAAYMPAGYLADGLESPSVCTRIWGKAHNHTAGSQGAGTHTHSVPIDGAGVHVHSGSTGSAGKSIQDNRPYYIALHYIIRVK